MTTTDNRTFLVAGAGLTAAKAVEALRTEGFGGRIAVLGQEQHLPYERPPLSKGFLNGDDPLDSVFTHSQEWYAEHDVDLHLGTTVTAIDTAGHTVTAGDEQHHYDKLLIATGSVPRHLPIADDAGAPVTYLRTIEDAEHLVAAFTPERRLAIIGGGWIGLEVASAARNKGLDVTVLETLELPLLRVLGPEVAQEFVSLHEDHGVDLRVSCTVSSIQTDGGRTVLRLGDGSTVVADLLVVGVGAVPCTELAEAAGIDVDNGIVVDEWLRTSVSDVYAAGDVANAYHPRLARHLRVEHWDNAIEQGAAAGRSMLDSGVSYDRLPYFFTDQYDFGMEYVGSVGPEGYDEVVVRRAAEPRTFTAFWVRAGQVLAGMHANDWDAIDPVRAIVGSPAVAELWDESVPLERVAAAALRT